MFAHHYLGIEGPIFDMDFIDVKENRASSVSGCPKTPTNSFQSCVNGDLAFKKALEFVESERATLAKELHDGILTSLAAIKLKLELICARREGKCDSIQEVIGYVEDTVNETRQLSKGLRGKGPDDLDLFSLLRRHRRMIEDCNDGLKVELRIEIAEDMVPRSYKIAIYRIFQEAAVNAIRHGHADRITFRLLAEAGKLVFYIEDNGMGFDIGRLPETVSDLNGNGLRNMRERAEFAGGTFEVRSRIGSGTRILAAFPATNISS